MAGLRAMVERDEQVIRKLLALLIQKGFCTRNELAALMRQA